MVISEVNSARTRKQFLQASRIPYKNDAEWVCHLDADIEGVFDAAKNDYFSDGEAIRWVLTGDDGKLLGRVAAFYSRRNFEGEEKKIGGVGFFECTNDQPAANMLFDACKKWLQSKGVEGMDGPINFGERDKYWGLMVSGFKKPSYQENYNPPYYQRLFENYGFEILIEQSTSEITTETFNYERFSKLGGRVLANSKYTFEHFRKKDMPRFARDFMQIYNEAWQHHKGFVPLTYERIHKLMKEMMPIIVEDIIWFVYADGKPAGFYVNIIDLNQLMRHVNGKMNWWGKLKFFWHLKTKKVNRVRGTVYGLVPQYQNLGLDTGMIMKFYDAVMAHPEYQYVELAWIGDFNPKMHSLLESLGARRTKIHYTYRLLF